MELIIDGKKAVLADNTSFDYISENRAFSGADAYTMSINLPLAGCSENLAIFGHLDRMDVGSRLVAFEAAIIEHSFSKFGVLTVVEANEKEVKCQFLEGRSVQNFLTTFDDIYVNELDLGTAPVSLPIAPAYGDIDHGADCVALPWVNDSADGFLNNEVVVENGNYKWADSTKQIGSLSYMPYLITIAKRICQQVGYTCDFSEWEESDERFLLICNVLPASWDMPQFARALPHWSVSEFFEELEKILVCEIDIDHRARHIALTFSKSVAQSLKTVRLDNLVDSFSSDMSYEDSLCQFKGNANIRYASRDDSQWQLDQCQWFVDMMRLDPTYFKEFDTLEAFYQWQTATFGLLGPNITSKDAERGEAVGSLIHIVSSDKYYVWRVFYCNLKEYPNMYSHEFVEINRFGDILRSDDDSNDIELNFVPARIDFTDSEHGYCPFLAPSGFDQNEDLDSDGIRQPAAYSSLLRGEPDRDAEYYDKIYLAYWDGHSYNQEMNLTSGRVLPPCPFVDKRFNLAIRYAGYLDGLRINPKERMKLSWIGTAIPEVRNIFHIKGRRYLCEKITATFTEDGMSELMKGEFWPLVE